MPTLYWFPHHVLKARGAPVYCKGISLQKLVLIVVKTRQEVVKI